LDSIKFRAIKTIFHHTKMIFLGGLPTTSYCSYNLKAILQLSLHVSCPFFTNSMWTAHTCILVIYSEVLNMGCIFTKSKILFWNIRL